MKVCPYTFEEAKCEIALDLMVSLAAEEEALETFHLMQDELQHYIHRVEILEELLTRSGIALPND